MYDFFATSDHSAVQKLRIIVYFCDIHQNFNTQHMFLFVTWFICFSGSSPSHGKGREQDCNQQSSSLVRIGEVLYRSSKLKLTRSLTPKCKNESGRSVADSNVKSKYF